MPGHFLRKQSEKRSSWGVVANWPFSHGFLLAIVEVNAFFFTLQMFPGIGKVKSIDFSVFFTPAILSHSLPFHFSGFRRCFLHQFCSTFVCNNLANSNDGFQSNSPRRWRVKNLFSLNSFIHALMGIMHGPAQYTPDHCRDACLHLAEIKSTR